jgi:capsule polysaccharide export protein KpsE/RkpR
VDPVNEILTSTVDGTQESEQSSGYEGLGLQPEPAVAPTPPLEAIDVAWLLWGERRFLGQCTAAGLVAFLLLAFLLPKHYTATAQLMPPDFNSSSDLMMALPAMSSGGGSESSGGGGVSGGGGTGSLMGLASKLLGVSSSGDLFIGVLRSRTIEDDIIKRFDLMDLYSVKYPEDARKELEDITDIKSDAKTGILSIAVEDKKPWRAAAIAQAYVDELNQVLATVNNSSAHRERIFVEKRREEVKKELDDAAQEFGEFASANTALDIPEQAKAMVAAAADLQGQLITAQSMLSGLQQIYTDDNHRVRELKAQIGELMRQLDKVGGKDVTPANGSVLSSSELYPSIRQLPLLGVRYLDLFRKNKIDEAVYELLTKQYEIARFEEARDVPTAQVLDAPVVPQKKTRPHRIYIIAGGMFFSLACGIAWILGGSRWKRTDPQMPWKVFVEEVASACKANTWDSPLGVRIREKAPRLKAFVSRNQTEDPAARSSSSADHDSHDTDTQDHEESLTRR